MEKLRKREPPFSRGYQETADLARRIKELEATADNLDRQLIKLGKNQPDGRYP